MRLTVSLYVYAAHIVSPSGVNEYTYGYEGNAEKAYAEERVVRSDNVVSAIIDEAEVDVAGVVDYVSVAAAIRLAVNTNVLQFAYSTL